ncbi:MAG TPA: IS110 family transposase [Terrimicrobiaceae bacterium]
MEKTTRRLWKANVTIGLDLGDKRHTFFCARQSWRGPKEGLATQRAQRACKAGKCIPGGHGGRNHSPWISRFLDSLGMEVVVANPRKTRTISQSERKSDERDALVLARLGRADRNLLNPAVHGSEEAQHDLLQTKLRDNLVRARVAVINSVRFTLKSLGYRVSNPSSERFHKLVMEEVPGSVGALIAHGVASIAELTARIKALEVSIARLATEKYPQTIYLQQVSGVGPITSLYFVLKIEKPQRFKRTRDIGAFVGLWPKRDQSGDKELRISKCGDQYLRCLLVNAAQYILGPFGTDSALREHGLRLAQEGTARAKKRAVVAVARKLAVLLLTLWKSREPYESFPTMA